MGSENLTSRVETEILAYLTEHPDAQDTLEGIEQWWLPERKVRYETTPIKEALGELVRKGVVVEVKVQDSSPAYRLARKKRRD